MSSWPSGARASCALGREQEAKKGSLKDRGFYERRIARLRDTSKNPNRLPFRKQMSKPAQIAGTVARKATGLIQMDPQDKQDELMAVSNIMEQWVTDGDRGLDRNNVLLIDGKRCRYALEASDL